MRNIRNGTSQGLAGRLLDLLVLSALGNLVSYLFSSWTHVSLTRLPCLPPQSLPCHCPRKCLLVLTLGDSSLDLTCLLQSGCLFVGLLVTCGYHVRTFLLRIAITDNTSE